MTNHGVGGDAGHGGAWWWYVVVVVKVGERVGEWVWRSVVWP